MRRAINDTNERKKQNGNDDNDEKYARNNIYSVDEQKPQIDCRMTKQIQIQIKCEIMAEIAGSIGGSWPIS